MAEGEEEDVSFLRTEDMVCLSCTDTGERVCLSAEGFGNRHCFLESIADRNYPADLSQCVFVIDQALSVRALQEILTASPDAGNSGMGSGHKTLLYGNAILLRHANSGMFLACLSSNSGTDKLAFDVGLQESSEGEACWWTVQPTSKQRSEGEKVRTGDDSILVSVATERYLQATKEDEKAIVNASFHVTNWILSPYGTGISREKNVSFVFAGEVIRFLHAGDECLTVPPDFAPDNAETNIVVYEGGSCLLQARSLWRLELARIKWCGGYINWYHPMRIKHITTGMYLGVNEENQLMLIRREDANLANSCFYLREEKDDNKVILEEKDLEIIGTPIVKYDDKEVIVQHIESGLWLSYKTYQVKKPGVGLVEEKQVILHEEGRMDDSVAFSRSQEDEARTARVIRKCSALFNQFSRGLDAMQDSQRHSGFFRMIDLGEMVGCLEDLVTYFAQPEEDLSNEDRQKFMRALTNRQDLFQEEGILNLILEMIDKMTVITASGMLSSLAGEESGQQWDDVSTYLTQLLAAVIKGNHTNCSQFAQASRLNWLFSKLGGEGAGMMDVLYCILNDSPEALNMMKEEHIKVIISLLEKFGRDPKVLDILCNLCVGSGVAVRSSQNNITDFLLPGKNLLLHTSLVDHVASALPNLFVGSVQNSALYSKWYFEVAIDHVEQMTSLPPHFRVGWANTAGYVPYPGGGEKWGGNGVGDDLYSFGFDGAYLWTGGKSTLVIPSVSQPHVKKGDNIGIALDLTVPIITFFLNGMKVPGYFRNFNLDGMFFPVVSASSKISCRFLFGGDHGRLKYAPPENFSPLFECLLPAQQLYIDPGFYFGELHKTILSGPLALNDDVAFVPNPVDTTTIQLQPFVENIRDKLAENIHEMWAVTKIETGWTYGDIRDDNMMSHPCLTQFQNLPTAEKRYNIQLGLQTMKTIVALGYNISMDKPPARIRPVRLPNDPYLQPNGYKPAPLDLSAIELTSKMEELVDRLAENTHNVWARERISQGWTYGLNEDSEKRRSPHLVSYKDVDESIKIANRNTSSETVRTLLVYGYVLDPPTGDQTAEEGEEAPSKRPKSRTYRVEKFYGVDCGKWYYEAEILTEGPIKLGWTMSTCSPDFELGGDDASWAYNGYNEEKVHAGTFDTYGKHWGVGDIIGVFLDMTDKTISFSLNGELLVDPAVGDAAFNEVVGESFVPACTLETGQRVKLNFGHDVDTLKFFTLCGLQEGYEPFCVNMTRPLTFWYSKQLPIFENAEDLPNTKIDVTRMPAGADNPPSLKVSHNTYEQEEKADWEFLRLSLPVTCNDRFISEHEKARRWHEYQVRQGRAQGQQRRNAAGQPIPPDRQRRPSAQIEDPGRNPNEPVPLDNEALDLINEYFYGIRIFPGQEPNLVYLGWVTTGYHIYSKEFSHDLIRVATIQKLDSYGGVQESLDRHSSYMVRADELYAEVSQDPSGKAPSTGLFIGCFIDTSTGIVSFTCEGKETKQRFKMEPGTKLFPAIFVKATSKDALQFELGRTSNSLPLSSAVMLNSGKHSVPQFPGRLKVQCLKPNQWSRVPNVDLKIHALKLSDIRGWSLLCEDAISMIALHIPEEDRCIDIMESIEYEKLLSFHVQTLKLYSALCFQSNHRAQHAICHYCDERQLVYAISSEFMPGPLRCGFVDTLISLHLESYAGIVEVTQNEFVVVMSTDIQEMYADNVELGNSMTSLQFESIRPQMSTSDITNNFDDLKTLATPAFPLEVVRNIAIAGLEQAFNVNQVHNRDPIGGSNEDLFVPLFKLLDNLLLVGTLSEEDVAKILIMIHPQSWDPTFDRGGKDEHTKGILQMKIHEGVKLQMCKLLHHLCDVQLRHRVEYSVGFSQGYMKLLQSDQLRRYVEIKQSDMPSATAAKKTKEFRCPPREQLNTILGFKTLEGEDLEEHPLQIPLREKMEEFHDSLMGVMAISSIEEEDVEPEAVEEGRPSVFTVIMKTLKDVPLVEEKEEVRIKSPEEKFRKVLVETIIGWGCETEIENTELVRQMFSLLLRQYDTVGELMRATEQTYVIDTKTRQDAVDMWVSLSRIRSLLPVQMSKEEEELVREYLWTLVNNHVFFQHPDLIRILKIHENVIQIMMTSIARAEQEGDEGEEGAEGGDGEQVPVPADAAMSSSYEMVVACCRFLCYFCRTSKQNQKAMFDHLIDILDNSNILLSRPSLRGSTPLDVAYSSLMDNTELALALREHYLEKITAYLARCGINPNTDLIGKGYPDLGWDPVEGERFLDFLRFCVWVGGESVEENANLIIRLLIRKPECLGPSLQGEGEGLKHAIVSGNLMSEQIRQQIETGRMTELGYMHPVPQGDTDEDFIDTGAAILSFYCTLVDLLGRCAPEATLIAQGKNDSLRARAILRSLVPLEDLEGVLSLPFTIPMPGLGYDTGTSDLPTGLVPNHKQSMALFLERVYGVENRELFFSLLENAFLPDLRAASMLEKPDGGESDMGLALNRYIGNSIMPALIKYSRYYAEAENYNPLLEATLHTVYRLSKGKMLTNVQRSGVSDFLVTLTQEIHPAMLLNLLRQLAVDLKNLNEYSSVALGMLTQFYERCSKYYGSPVGQAGYGCASDEEKRLTMTLFSSIFDSLSTMEYDPVLFGQALPCLTAIACALPPDYAKPNQTEEDMFEKGEGVLGPYNPMPINTSQVQLTNEMNTLIQKFSEQYHDTWAQKKQDANWTYGQERDEDQKKHPRLKPYSMLDNYEKETYRDPIRYALQALMALGWSIENTDPSGAAKLQQQQQSGGNIQNYKPNPADLSTLTLTKEMVNLAERLAEDGHDIQALLTKQALQAAGGGPINLTLVPYDLLTEKEKRKTRERCQELLKYIQFLGYNLFKSGRDGDGDRASKANPENRFANNLLEKLIGYLDSSVPCMKLLRPSNNFTRRNSFRKSHNTVKFFSKVVLPVIEKYFNHQKNYFTAAATLTATAGVATIIEKEAVAMLFCKLANLLRLRMAAFGCDEKQAVKCLQVLIKAVDARALAKSRPEFIRTSMLTFFNNCADDLEKTIVNLHEGKYPHLRGTHMKTCTSFKYIFEILVPVLTSTFDHLAVLEYGPDLLVDEIQVACYKVLESLYILGTNLGLTKSRKFLKTEIAFHRGSIGTCLSAFSATFPVAFLEPTLSKFNPNSVLGSGFSERSLEAQEVTARVEQSLPNLDSMISDVDKFIEEGKTYSECPQIIDVILPFLCSYLPNWWLQGPDNVDPKGGSHITMVTADHMNQLLKLILKLITKNAGDVTSEWMITISRYSVQIIINTSEEILKDPLLPLTEKVRKKVEAMYIKEESLKGFMKASADDASQIEGEILEEWNLIIRDIYAFYPLMIKYVDIQKNYWIRENVEEAEQLYNHVGEIFNVMSVSDFFKKEENAFILNNEIDTMALLMPSTGKRALPIPESSSGGGGGGGAKKPKKVKKDKGKKDSASSSLVVAALKRILPVGMNLFAGKEQEMVQHCKDRYLQKMEEELITEFVKNQLTLPEKLDPADELCWQHHLYSTLGNKKSIPGSEMKKEALELLISRIVAMGKVLYGLHIIDHPSVDVSKDAFPKVVSIQRKRAVIACFRQTSLHSLPRHVAVNLFLRTFRELWLEDENSGQEVLIDHLTQTFEDAEMKKGEEEEEEQGADQLKQLVHVINQGALAGMVGEQQEDVLYMAYANIMAVACGGEEDEDGDDEGEGPSLEEQEIEKMKLLFNQNRLAQRGATELVLTQITACKGAAGDMIENTLNLGIAILNGGNKDAQMEMCNYLKDKKDSGFFTSISSLINSCTVLNLDAFERNTKAEGLGVGPDGPAGEKNMYDSDFCTLIFRFIQLTSEGHNADWQNYLRTQVGNPVNVNLVLCTVDYLLKLQESMMDFYWYYSRKDVIDPAGLSNMLMAVGVASQVFNTIIEVLQGPCVGNQHSLSGSRLWDAVSGFLFLFANMQEKLSKDASQVELLQELLNLQNDLITCLLAMMEGSTLNGTICKKMVDTMVESSANVEQILNYFKLFLNIPSEDDLGLEDGCIHHKDFKDKLDGTKNFSPSEIEFLVNCNETDPEGNIDFSEFSERYLEPAKGIGFNWAVLLTQLSEHMPNEPRLAQFLESAGEVLEFFEPKLGRIEIKTADKVERVYFEIDEDNIEQWEKPQIKESKRAFFYATLTEGGDKEKMEVFVDFCEDAIFEMQHAAALMATGDEEGTTGKKEITIPSDDEPKGIIAPLKEKYSEIKGQITAFLMFFSPSNLKEMSDRAKQMTPIEIALAVLTGMFWTLYGFGYFVIRVMNGSYGILLGMMRGSDKEVVKKAEEEDTKAKKPIIVVPEGEEGDPGGGGEAPKDDEVKVEKSPQEDLGAKQLEAMEAVEKLSSSKAAKSEPSPFAHIDFNKITTKLVSFLARNFFTLKLIALVIAFTINFMLLFYKVSVVEEDEDGGEDDGEPDVVDVGSGEEGEEGGEDDEPDEYVHVDEKYYYLEYIIRVLGITHAIVSVFMCIAYYNLKVPLAVFKREKEVARRMEFDGLYLSEQPEDDDMKGHWDKLVISAKSFPNLYWDKFVKKRVRQKYAEQFEFDAISNILGMEKSALASSDSGTGGIFAMITSIDWKYQVWKTGITVTDNPFLYQLGYCFFSVLGNYNYFFFAAHLLDVAVGVAALRIILEAITHNGKQLVLTVMLLTIVVYIYTVIAFNFFRKFYVSGEEDEVDQKCHDMFTCFVFNLYQGVRAGGGIGDVIEPPDGDDYEVYRIFFDISFFFFIIVILLAIIQGFIIDAFGALRDQMQGVEDELENNCFICGIGKDYLDSVPHGFDIHVQKEHNLANYLFFIMYLINKDETEYTGQETFVWDMYQSRCWDFFPAGECFRKQYESELEGGGGGG